MNSQTNKLFKVICVLLVVLSLFLFDWVCPVEKIFGIPCPGCNMTTAAYWLFIKHDIHTALYYHAMLPLTILVTILCLLFPRWIKKWLWLWALAMIVYWLYRMVFIFPDMPMVYSFDSVLGQILKTFS